ncbi:hypothetical protein PanWU01x14_167760 [Parasponia andersonii]|uniref:Uncharacterized protein n=1 Tax=Parasponia andersonii TaxID=3476 RepID=A0A2P5CAW7_PARAD|nr:hypothetical protein PanWU01x14_167760 [Parasponia andersonii]
MISAKGLELKSFIDPGLTWKNDTKGYRRSTRRSRKPIERSPRSDADLTDKGAESPSETTVSESEKLGVAVLGQRFSEKIEHVPIKKRRFTVRSPSPPPCFSSPQVEDGDQFVDGPYSSDPQSYLKLISKKRLIAMDASRKMKNVKPRYGDDFSGIEILAAAACNNNVGDDENHVDDNLAVLESFRDPRDKLVSAFPPKECISSKGATHSSPIDKVVEAARECSDLPGHADLNHHDGATGKHNDADRRTVDRSVSSRDVRLHWDLNVEMDAWEQPCDTFSVDSQKNALEDLQSVKLQVLEACELEKESRDVKNDIGTPLQPIIESEEHKFEPSSDKNEDEYVPSDKAFESSTFTGFVAEKSQDVTRDAITNVSLCNVSDKIEVSVLSEGTNKTSSTDSAAKQVNEDLSLGAQPSMEEKLEGVDCEVDRTLRNEDGVGSAMVSRLHGDLKSQEIISSGSSCPPVPVSKAEDVGISRTELCNEDITASGVSLGEGQPIIAEHEEEQVAEALSARTDDSKAVSLEFADNSIPILEGGVGSSSHEVSKKCGDNSASRLGRVAIEDACGDSHTLDVCDKDLSGGKGNTMDCHNHDIAGKENPMEFDTGYDSQYEDGELRESDVPYREDNDCDYGEAECVDYGSDLCDDTGDYSMCSKFGMQVEWSEDEFCGPEVRSLDRNMKVERMLCEKVEHGTAGDALRQHSMGPKIITSGSDDLPRGSEISSNRVAEITESCIIRKHNADCLDPFDDKDSPAKVVGSGVSRKELSVVVESSSSDPLRRSDSILEQRSRSSNFDLCTQAEAACDDHCMGKERSDLQTRWDLRRRESPTYNGSFGSERPRPKSVIEGCRYAMHPEAVGIAGMDNHVHRQAINSSSNGLYRHPLRRRSPANRDDAQNMRRGMLPLRDTSPDRRRFRRYPQGVGRDFREEYQRTLPHNGSDEYPYHVSRMVRREQNTSPPPRGPVYYRRPYKRSQSRSRSRSPGSWVLPREHEFAKHHSSRSPDYRSVSRMERMRLPFQKSFGAKYEMGFMSAPRRRFSPQHNSRWFDDQNGAPDHFRGRRLPTRTFQQQGQRFESVGSSRRLNSDDYYEPTMRPTRFSGMGRGGRVRRFEGSDDERRKHEIFPRGRHSDSDGVVRRFRYDEEDSFASRNTHNYNDSDNSNGAERRPRNNVYAGELAKRVVN